MAEEGIKNLAIPGEVEPQAPVTREQFINLIDVLPSAIIDATAGSDKGEVWAIFEILQKNGKSVVRFEEYRKRFPSRSSENRLSNVRGTWNKITNEYLRYKCSKTAFGKLLYPSCQVVTYSNETVLTFEWRECDKRARAVQRTQKAISSEIQAIHQPSSDAVSNNIPAELTRFFGRDGEVVETRELLLRERLITLTGAGGVGKTRLAHHVASCCLGQFSGGVWTIDLAPVSEARWVLAAIANGLRITETADKSLMDLVQAVVGTRSTLLIINNCEHLAAACASAVEGLLCLCPNLRVLATSRRLLEVPGEIAYPVRPLPLPPEGATLSSDELLKFDSILMFADRARGGRVPFQVDKVNAAMVAEICRRLDGIPMFLALAGARAKRGDSALVILQSLRNLFEALGCGSPTAHPKDRSARTIIDWSYDPLGEGEKQALRRLSVFRGGWPLEGAVAVCSAGGISADGASNLLYSLLGASMIEELAVPPGSQPRFRLLEPIREYVTEKFVDQVDQEQTIQRHARWLLALALEAERKSKGPQRQAWLRRLETEIDNFRAALERAASSVGLLEDGMTLAIALKWLWIESGRVIEGESRLRALLNHAGTSARTAARARALLCMCGFRPIRDGLSAGNLALAEESLAIAVELGDQELEADSLNCLGEMAPVGLDWRTALSHHRRAFAIAKERHMVRGMCESVLGIAHSLSPGADRGEVREHLDLCLKSAQAGDEYALAQMLAQLAREGNDTGRYPEARYHWAKCLEVYRILGHIDGHLDALAELAKWYIDDENGSIRDALLCQHLPKSKEFLREALEESDPHRDAQRMAQALMGLGHCHRFGGDSGVAIVYFDQAVERWRNGRPLHGSGSIILQAAFERLRVKDLAAAKSLIIECLDHCGTKDQDAARWGETMLALAASQEEQHEEAIEKLRWALDLAQCLGHGGTILFTLYLLANELVLSGRIEEAAVRANEVYRLSSGEHSAFRGACHLLLGSVAIAQGHIRSAKQQYNESLQTFAQHGRINDITIAIQAMGIYEANKGKHAKAARLFGAADRPSDGNMIFARNPHYQRFAAEVRAELGANEFQSAFTEGKTLSLKKVVTLLREDRQGRKGKPSADVRAWQRTTHPPQSGSGKT